MERLTTSLSRLRERNRVLLILSTMLLLILLCLICFWWWYPLDPDSPPVANANGPYMIGEGQQLTFNAAGSTGSNLTYTWDFGDGTGQGNGVSPTYIYPDGPAQYTVTLTVTDDQGRMASAATQVTVNNLPPTAEASGPYTCEVNETIQLAGGCNDPSPIDAQTVSCAWADFSGAAIAQPNYTCPATPDQVTVTLTATDKDGASAQDTADITVTSPPSPSIVADAGGPYTGMIGSPILFDGSGSRPVDLIEEYIWDFGDGSIESSPNATISHTYQAVGTYTVLLTVAGTAATGVATDTTTTTVSTLPNSPPVAVIQCPPKLRSKYGRCLRFDGSRSFDPDGIISTYAWDFNDDNAIDSTGSQTEYCYPARGSYLVSLIVTDDKGAEHRSVIAVEIW